MIPVRAGSHARVPIHATEDGPGTADIIRHAGRALGWREQADVYGAPSWEITHGGRITYEPGGQVEISSPVMSSPGRLARFLGDTIAVLRASAQRAGILLLTAGTDPYNTLERTPLELHAPRYDAMARYFDGIGVSGARMMRQTAALQVSVELGPHPESRWMLLNSIAPYLLAATANSSMYAGTPTGYASYRAHLWQTLDPTRTGLPFDRADPVGAYALFAARAGRIMSDDAQHMTTLFPEIRPRGYFEIRCMDSGEPESVAQVMQLISALLHDADVAAAAQSVVGQPEPLLLERAARYGPADPVIGQRLRVLEQLAAQSHAAQD
ncbi:MAG: glutamate-cysteine ligase family protein [Gemmatimonadaceae bacterium]